MNFSVGFRPEPAHIADTRPKFGLIRDQLVAQVGASFSQAASDLRIYSPKRHNQLTSESCVVNSSVRGLEIEQIQSLYKENLAKGMGPANGLADAKMRYTPLSRLAMYYIARELMSPSEVNMDEGTMVSLAAEVIRQFGVCAESLWPFELDKIKVSPSWTAMQQAYLQRIVGWYRIETTGIARVNDVILALAAGKTVVYGTQIDQSWMDYDGSRPLQRPVQKIIGGHATVLEGWDPAKGLFLGENSWSESWGVMGPDGTGGFYEMEPEVIEDGNLSTDFVVYESGWENWGQAT